jgi:hypothetical protein
LAFQKPPVFAASCYSLGNSNASPYSIADQPFAVRNHPIVHIAFQQPAAVSLQKVALLVDIIGFLHKNSRVHVFLRPETIEYQTPLDEFSYFIIDASEFPKRYKVTEHNPFKITL